MKEKWPQGDVLSSTCSFSLDLNAVIYLVYSRVLASMHNIPTFQLSTDEAPGTLILF